MARKRKPSGRLHKGPFTAADIERAIRLDGWTRIKGKTRHPAFEHPTKASKVNFSTNWDGIKYGREMFRSVASQAELSPKELLRLLNS